MVQNCIFTVLLGGAVDCTLRGTSDSIFYTYYFTVATVSAKWGLLSLGRWDCGANILALVANEEKSYTNIVPAGIDGSGGGGVTLFLNMTYPGPRPTACTRPAGGLPRVPSRPAPRATVFRLPSYPPGRPPRVRPTTSRMRSPTTTSPTSTRPCRQLGVARRRPPRVVAIALLAMVE